MLARTVNNLEAEATMAVALDPDTMNHDANQNAFTVRYENEKCVAHWNALTHRRGLPLLSTSIARGATH